MSDVSTCDAPAVPASSAAAPLRCALEHRLFSALGDVSFRRSGTDGEPVMVLLLGEREAAITLRSLRREFGIEDETPDAEMLVLVARSLDYVDCIRPGDHLPREILTGEASWEPDAIHRRIASARLELQLVAWLTRQAGEETTEAEHGAVLQLVADPTIRRDVQDALRLAAETLGLPGPEAVVQMLEEMAGELAYIEALRDRLLRPAEAMTARLAGVLRAGRLEAGHLEMLTQVQRLSAGALRQVRTRFEELDAQTGEVLSALRNAVSQRAFIRGHRDWLYRSLRLWAPILQAWAAEEEAGEGLWALIARTYQFLALHFLPVTEWHSPHGKPKETHHSQLNW
jgi:hypothetical protein